MNAPAPTEVTLAPIEGPQAWTGTQMARSDEWKHTLTSVELHDLDAAVLRAEAKAQDLVTMGPEDFALPQLGARLQAMRDSILNGPGFFLLRGVPVGRYSPLQAALAFRGVGAHLGEALSQNGKGHVLGHVADLGLDYAAANTRGYQTSEELRFHTDGGDIVGLLCIKPARTGGLSRIASSTTVWNTMVERRPDLAAILRRPFYFTRWGEVGEGQAPWVKFPLFTPHVGRMIVFFVMSAIEKAQALPGVPALTLEEREAFEMVNTLANEDGIRLDMDFQPGDMQFLCNHSILHARTRYEDWPDPAQRRHLLRLWLACPGGPELPEHITNGFQGGTDSGRPAGIRVPGVPLVAPLEPL